MGFARVDCVFMCALRVVVRVTVLLIDCARRVRAACVVCVTRAWLGKVRTAALEGFMAEGAMIDHPCFKKAKVKVTRALSSAF